jgi:phosphoserine phosphatase
MMMMGVMDYVITLVVDSDRLRLPQAFVDSMAQVLSMQDIRVEKTEWVKAGVAVDFFVPYASKDFDKLNTLAQDAVIGHPFDVIVQPAAARRKKLLIADMESTMVTAECLDELAKYVGMEKKISAITERAMNGEIDFKKALAERVALLKGLPETALQEVMDEKVKPMPGAKALVRTMKKNGAHTLLVTGGFDFFAAQVKDMLGFDDFRANRLEVKNGNLTGKVLAPVLDKNAKLKALQDARKKLKLSPDDVLAVGDGANDLPMLLAAGLGVAYHAKPAVRDQAKHKINHCNLNSLVFAQGMS